MHTLTPSRRSRNELLMHLYENLVLLTPFAFSVSSEQEVATTPRSAKLFLRTHRFKSYLLKSGVGARA